MTMLGERKRLNDGIKTSKHFILMEVCKFLTFQKNSTVLGSALRCPLKWAGLSYFLDSVRQENT